MNLPGLTMRLLFGRRLGVHRGELAVPGIAAPVTIRRDRHGIPVVDAANDADAFFGLGFCHGQDRTFQLETILRLVRGTLSELVGPAGVPIDRVSRRVGFRHYAAVQVEVQWPETRTILDAYCAGVNAGVTLGRRSRPHEFLLLGGRPSSDWTAADVLAFVQLQSFVLAANWDVELARLRIALTDGVAALRAIDPIPDSIVSRHPPELRAAAEKLAEDLAAFAAAAPVGGGSNNWAIAGSRTATGRPLLASDPHLAPNLPAPWYLAHLRTPEWDLVGGSFVGSPGVMIGHNGFCAWGLTAGLADNTDLFLEQVNPDGRSVRRANDWQPCPVRREVIKVKGQPDVVEEVLTTPQGPLLSPVLGVDAADKASDPAGRGEWPALSLRAMWQDPVPVRAFLCLARVRSWDEFRACFADWPYLSQNVVYADATGRIGYQFIGRMPRRRKGGGTLPMPGWDAAYDWHFDPVPFEQLPCLSDPPAGFVATANAEPPANPHGVYLGGDFLDPYRADAIKAALTARNGWTLADCQQLQRDVRTPVWAEIADVVTSVKTDHDDVQTALELLRAWDGRVESDSAAATVYELFVAEMVRRVVHAKVPRSSDWALGKMATVPGANLFGERRAAHLSRLLRTRPAGWFPSGWGPEIADALATAVLALRTQRRRSRWGWGKIRPLWLRHPLLGLMKPWDQVFNHGPIAFGGDTQTIQQALVKPLNPTDVPAMFPSLRAVIDVGNWSASRFAVAGGQAGSPFSPNFVDQVKPWQGEGVAIPWTEEEIGRETRKTLQLVPKPV